MIKIFVFYLNISCIKINAIFTKSTVNILNILLSYTGEYQDNRPIQRRDMDSKTVVDSFVRKLSEGGVQYRDTSKVENMVGMGVPILI